MASAASLAKRLRKCALQDAKQVVKDSRHPLYPEMPALGCLHVRLFRYSIYYYSKYSKSGVLKGFAVLVAVHRRNETTVV